MLFALWAVLQALVFDLGRGAEWDEAVYLSEVTPGVPAVGMAAHRAWGIVTLVSPAAWAGGVLCDPAGGGFRCFFTIVRSFMAVVSLIGVLFAFTRWRFWLGKGAILAALLFLSTWQVLLYSGEVSPNLWASVFSVLAVKSAFESPSGTPKTRVGWLVLWFFLLAFVRPTDSIWVATGLGVAILLWRRNNAPWRTLFFCGLGVFLGWLPWIVDAFIRFQDPFNRLREASQVIKGGARIQFIEHLRLLDGPLMGPDRHPASPFGVGWWLLIFLFAALAVFFERKSQIQRGRADPGSRLALPCTVVAAFHVAPYLFLTGASAPRFLLPSYSQHLVVGAPERALSDLDGPRHAKKRRFVLVTRKLAQPPGWKRTTSIQPDPNSTLTWHIYEPRD